MPYESIAQNRLGKIGLEIHPANKFIQHLVNIIVICEDKLPLFQIYIDL